jgi:hypothetical protein
MNQEKARLSSASFTFTQEGNCVDGGIEELVIRCDSSLGIDNDGGCFYILSTEQWAVESTDELKELFDRISSILPKK